MPGGLHADLAITSRFVLLVVMPSIPNGGCQRVPGVIGVQRGLIVLLGCQIVPASRRSAKWTRNNNEDHSSNQILALPVTS